MSASSVTIIAYHRIDVPGSRDLAPALIDAYPAAFEAQMRYLAAHYNVVSSWDVVRALRDGYSLPPRAMVISFDDGYTCFRDIAMPILRRLGLPVTLFIATDYTSSTGKHFWWDTIYHALANTTLQQINLGAAGSFGLHSAQKREAAYDRLVSIIEKLDESEATCLVNRSVAQCKVEPGGAVHLLSWDDIKALADEGVAIGPHSRKHPILSKCTPQRIRDEVEGSWADVSEQIPSPLPLFCYPNGQPHSISRTAMAAVRRAGLPGAVTMVPGLNVPGRTNPFLMRRTGAVAGESLTHFKIKISPAGHIYRRMKAIVTRKPRPWAHL